MIEYDIITAETKHLLVQAINVKIKEGWQLQGGVSATAKDYFNEKLYQAIIKTN